MSSEPSGSAGGLGGAAVEVIVGACLRGGAGGSPTAVVTNGEGLQDVDLARIPSRLGTSHVAVIYSRGGSNARTLRFFTTEGELPGCGHGTVAAIAVLSILDAQQGFRGMLRVAGRDFEATGKVASASTTDNPAGPGSSGSPGNLVEAWFDQGVVRHRGATADESAAFLAALGLEPNAVHPADEISVASPGRERLMIPVVDGAVLAGLRPDQAKLVAASRRYGQLGCFVYVPPAATGVAAARMFAPAIGVPEDVANANSSGCLAAHLLITGRNPTVAVEQGDALGRPSTVQATAFRGEEGITARVGGTAAIVPMTPSGRA